MNEEKALTSNWLDISIPGFETTQLWVNEIADKIAESLGVPVGLLGNHWKNPSDAGSFLAQSERYRRFHGKLTRRLQRINCMPVSEFKFMVRMLTTKHKLRANRKKSKNRTVRGYWAKA